MLSLFAVGRSATGRKMVGTADASPRPQSERSSGNAEGSSRPSAQHVALDPLSTRQPVARDHFAGPTGIEPSGRPHVLTHGKGTTMSKATVARLFIGSVIAVTAGAILASMAVWLALANDVFVMAGPDVVGRYLVPARARHRRRSGDHGRSDRWPRVVDRRPAEQLAARNQVTAARRKAKSSWFSFGLPAR